MNVKIDVAPPDAAEWTGRTVPIEVGAGSVSDALVHATKLSTVEAFPDQVGFLLQHVGPRIVSTALGLKDGRQLTKWWRGDGVPKSRAMEARVYLLFQVAYAVTSVFDGATAARFLRVRSPYLGYVSPGGVLRTGDPDVVGGDILSAAGQFLGG